MTPDIASALTQTTITLMGISFMVGSLSTILILIFLDFVRLARSGGLRDMENAPTQEDRRADQ